MAHYYRVAALLGFYTRHIDLIESGFMNAIQYQDISDIDSHNSCRSFAFVLVVSTISMIVDSVLFFLTQCAILLGFFSLKLIPSSYAGFITSFFSIAF